MLEVLKKYPAMNYKISFSSPSAAEALHFASGETIVVAHDLPDAERTVKGFLRAGRFVDIDTIFGMGPQALTFSKIVASRTGTYEGAIEVKIQQVPA